MGPENDCMAYHLRSLTGNGEEKKCLEDIALLIQEMPNQLKTRVLAVENELVWARNTVLGSINTLLL